MKSGHYVPEESLAVLYLAMLSITTVIFLGMLLF
jgi:hypothetical protein